MFPNEKQLSFIFGKGILIDAEFESPPNFSCKCSFVKFFRVFENIYIVKINLSIIMSKVLRDIKSIRKLAINVHVNLERGNVRKARREIQRIIALDEDELTRLQKGHGDEKLLAECGIVLNNAKKALRDLDSFEGIEAAERLIDQIIAIERHELQKIKRVQEIEKEHYEIWQNYLYNGLFYQGTCSVNLNQIKTYGLSPSMRGFDVTNFKRLQSLFQKAGIEVNLIGILHMESEQSGGVITNGFFVTPSKDKAEEYAKDSITMWHEFIERLSVIAGRGLPTYWDKRDFKEALFEVYNNILFINQNPNLFYNQQTRKLQTKINQDARQLYQMNQKNFISKWYEYYKRRFSLVDEQVSSLSFREMYEVKRIFTELWNFFNVGKFKGAVVHISRKAPAIMKKLAAEAPMYVDFEKFLLEYKHFSPRQVIQDLGERDNLFITERIPSRYIVNYEYK